MTSMISLITVSEIDVVRQVAQSTIPQTRRAQDGLDYGAPKVLIEGWGVNICLVDVQIPQVNREERSEGGSSEVLTFNKAELGHFLSLQPVV